jgi:hypothetical protein
MSLSFQPLRPVLVRAPVTNITNERNFAIVKAGSQTSFKVYNSSNISQSSITFTCPPPSAKIITSRKVVFSLPVRLTFIGTCPVGQTLFQNMYDAPRAFPINGSIDTMQATINNYSVSVNSADIIHAMMHYNTGTALKTTDYSMTPTYQDQSQSYDDLIGTILNPLTNVGDFNDASQMPRGGFPMVIVQNPVSLGLPVTVIIDIIFNENLYLSPFYWGHGNESGFYNITSMDFNFTFLGQAANRMWSHSDRAGTAVITSSNFVFGGLPGGPTSFSSSLPNLQFEYITPQETMIIPNNMPITYDYYDIIRFPTDQNPTLAGASFNFPSNNIQLNSIPARVYVYVQEKNSDKYATATSTDTYFSIQNISLQFQNRNGLLASCSQQQLYQLSVDSGLKLSWSQWKGDDARLPGTFAPGNGIGLVGSVFCIDFPIALGLGSLESPGMLFQSQIQVQVTAKNISNRTITPTVWIVAVLAGTFTVQGSNQCSAQIGVISPTDILDANSQKGISYDMVKDHEGGNFWDSLKAIGSKILPFLRGAHDFIKENKLLSKGLSLVPHPGAQIGSKAARLVGYGDGDGYGYDEMGGVRVGGRRGKRAGNYVLGGSELHRDHMMERLKY